MSDNIPEWLKPYIKSNSYIPTREDIENLDPQSRKEMLLKYTALNSGGEEEDKYAAFKARVDGSLTEVTAEMLKGITSIWQYAFYYCRSLTSITIPNSVTSIGDSAFFNCSNLTSVEIPNSVTSIGEYAFFNCYNLTSIEIPNGVTRIAGRTFYDCYKLTSIEIPNGVTSIEVGAFGQCTGLSSVTVKSTTPPTLGYSIFYDVSQNLVIYVPAESVNAYKSASGWSSYADKIQAIPNN